MLSKKLLFLLILFFSKLNSNFVKIDFDNSMSISKYHTNEKNSYIYNYLKNLYEKNFNKDSTKKELKIPKIIHQIWIGSPLPKTYQVLQKSWKKYHPDWKYKLWTDKEIAELNLKNQKAFEATDNWGEKADIARYEILYRYGGLYIDTDFECLKSFEHLHYICDFYTGITYQMDALYNGLIACKPNCPIMKECVNNIKIKTKKDSKLNNIPSRTGIHFFANCFFKILPKLDDYKVIAFPLTYFYSFPYYNRNDKPETFKNWLKPESMAIHYWNATWIN